MMASSFPIVLRHLPGQHDQEAHAGQGTVEARLADLKPQDKVIRSDGEQDWQAFGLKRPTDAELLETFGLQDQGVNVSVYTDRIGYLHLQGSLNAGEFANEQVFQRTIARNHNTGEAIVSHDSFHLPEPLQKQGMGVDLLERSEDLYRKIGVNKILLTSDSVVGKYAWARMGFDFYGEEDRGMVQEAFRSYLSDRSVPFNEWPHMEHTWEIAAWDSRVGSGKDFLLHFSPSYDAAKRLGPKDEGYLVGQAYYKERRKHKS